MSQVGGSYRSVARRIHEVVGGDRGLEVVLQLLLGEADHTLAAVQSIHEQCAHEARQDPTWERTAETVRAAIDTGLFR